MPGRPGKFRGEASIRPVGGAGRARAQAPNPESGSKKQGHLLRDLDERKHEGNPLVLNGPAVLVEDQRADPEGPGVVSNGDRIYFVDDDDEKVALGVDGDGKLYFQAYPAGFDWWTSFTTFPGMRLTDGGTLAGALFVGTTSDDPHSTIQTGGSLAVAQEQVTANTSLDHTHCFVFGDATGGAFTVGLPDASGCAGRIYSILRLNAGANDVIVDGDGAETINGAATKTLASQYATITIISIGVGWLILSQLGTVT